MRKKTLMGDELIATTPEELMKLVVELAEARPADPDEYLRTEMRIDPEIMAEFHLNDLRDTLHAMFDGRSGTDPMRPVALDLTSIASIIAAHGTVMLMAGHQLGRKQHEQVDS